MNNFSEIKNIFDKKIVIDEGGKEGYVIQIIQRRKDNPNLYCSERVINYYMVGSINRLNTLMATDIIPICKAFKARAYINLNPKSKIKATLDFNIKVSERIKSGVPVHKNDWLSCLTSSPTVAKQKSWVIDIDYLEDNEKFFKSITQYLIMKKSLQGIVPTPNGLHIICSPFNFKEYVEGAGNILVKINEKWSSSIQGLGMLDLIHKEGLTLLYYEPS